VGAALLGTSRSTEAEARPAGSAQGRLDSRQQRVLPRPVRFEATAAASEATDAREIKRD
jgi:hypothetical protein